MSKQAKVPLLLALCLFILPAVSKAQVPVQAQDKKQIAAEDENGEPFKPGWDWALGLTFGRQPSDQGGGQSTNELDFTGTYNLTESGHFLSATLNSGQQKVEGAFSTYGGLEVAGGLGLGFFSPSLSFQAQYGTSELHSYSSTLTLGFKLLDPLTLSVHASGGFSSHQGPLSQIFGNSNAIVEIDTKNGGGGLSLTYAPWDNLSFTLASQQTWEFTYQIQNLAHTLHVDLDQSDRIPSISLGFDWIMSKDFDLNVTGQRGQEFYPAGRVYSPILGQTVDFSQPTSQYFSGYSLALTYSFK